LRATSSSTSPPLTLQLGTPWARQWLSVDTVVVGVGSRVKGVVVVKVWGRRGRWDPIGVWWNHEAARWRFWRQRSFPGLNLLVYTWNKALRQELRVRGERERGERARGERELPDAPSRNRLFD